LIRIFHSNPAGSPARPVADDIGLRKRVSAGKRQAAVERTKRHRRRRYLFNGWRPEPLPSYLGTVEDPAEGKLGVCCSGGGIRSAAFSLGALQVLQEKGELRKASYLAAVSGGAYIAAAISMVNKTGKDDSNPTLVNDRAPAFAPGSPEEQYLRNRCSYLAPSWRDKTYLGIRVVLGLLINLLFLSVPLVGVALILTGSLYAPKLSSLAGSWPIVVDYQVHLPTCFWGAPLVLLGLSLLAGLATLLVRWPAERWERFFEAWATRLLLGAGLLALVLIGVPYFAERIRDLSNAHSALGTAQANARKVGAGTLALLVGIAAQAGAFFRSKATREELEGARKVFAKLGSGVRLAIAYLAGALIGPLLLFSIFGLAVAMGLAEATRDGAIDWSLVGIGIAILLGFSLFYAVADLTTWSLHPYYKRRLSSAFALKRITLKDLKGMKLDDRFEAAKPSRQEPTGRPSRGIAVERDFKTLVPISDTALDAEKDPAWPTLLVCAAANISDTAATPPGRGVTSFTFSAHTVGGPLVGAVEMSQLERAFDGRRPEDPPGEGNAADDAEGLANVLEPIVEGSRRARTRVWDVLTARKHRRHDLSLMAAVAMSGAAISPSMGKTTSRPLRFLMALANIRLGVWVPNPRWVAKRGRPSKFLSRPRPSYLLREFVGRNSVDAKYLYVTDGGHYENLGLVELLRRGCTQIYCLDASGVGGDGAELGALGEAIALARSELQVEIEFDGEPGGNPEELKPDADSHLSKSDVITGKIKFPPSSEGEEGLEGKLIYVRNTMTDEAPWDVRAHNEADPRFPNNPTVDQLYTDQKFEAYRVLGALAGVNAVAARARH